MYPRANEARVNTPIRKSPQSTAVSLYQTTLFQSNELSQNEGSDLCLMYIFCSEKRFSDTKWGAAFPYAEAARRDDIIPGGIRFSADLGYDKAPFAGHGNGRKSSEPIKLGCLLSNQCLHSCRELFALCGFIGKPLLLRSPLAYLKRIIHRRDISDV